MRLVNACGPSSALRRQRGISAAAAPAPSPALAAAARAGSVSAPPAPAAWAVALQPIDARERYDRPVMTSRCSGLSCWRCCRRSAGYCSWWGNRRMSAALSVSGQGASPSGRVCEPSGLFAVRVLTLV
jgi:hypothetical protein